MIILDTCVISECLKPSPSAALMEWIDSIPEEQAHLPSIALGELQKGVELLVNGKKRQALRLWLEQLRQRFDGKILSFDEDSAILWGDLSARLIKLGKPTPVVDGMIAAIALKHDALLATRNAKDFRDTGVKLVNPFAAI
jgi:toxin FitB